MIRTKIHAISEKLNSDGNYEKVSELSFSDYPIFAFLADVRNYSELKPLSFPRGVPKNSDLYQSYISRHVNHSGSFLELNEIIEFDYDKKFENMTYNNRISIGLLSGTGFKNHSDVVMCTYREFLGINFFSVIKKLIPLKVDRIVFYFYEV